MRRRAQKDLGKCFGDGRVLADALANRGGPGDKRDSESPKQSGDFIGAKVRDFDYYRRREGTRPPLSAPEEETK